MYDDKRYARICVNGIQKLMKKINQKKEKTRKKSLYRRDSDPRRTMSKKKGQILSLIKMYRVCIIIHDGAWIFKKRRKYFARRKIKKRLFIINIREWLTFFVYFFYRNNPMRIGRMEVLVMIRSNFLYWSRWSKFAAMAGEKFLPRHRIEQIFIMRFILLKNFHIRVFYRWKWCNCALFYYMTKRLRWLEENFSVDAAKYIALLYYFHCKWKEKKSCWQFKLSRWCFVR